MQTLNFLLKICILSNVYGRGFGKSYHSDTSTLLTQQLDHSSEAPIEAVIRRLNHTDAAALAEVMQKEPKFFDEFECK